MKTLVIISSLLLSIQSLAARNPNGSYGNASQIETVPGTSSKVCDSSEWADDFINVFNENEDSEKGRTAIQTILTGMKNEPDFCPSPLKTAAGAKLFALELAEAFFVKESGCNPSAANPHAPNGTAIGFGQMGIDDAKNHKCTTVDGKRITSSEQLKSAENNARCVAQIMINCGSGLNGVGKNHLGKIADGNRGQNGFVGCFWQPLRKGTGGDGQGGSVDNQSNREAIQEVSKNFCEKASQGSDAVVQAQLAEPAIICSAMNNASCRTNGPNGAPRMTRRASRTAI